MRNAIYNLEAVTSPSPRVLFQRRFWALFLYCEHVAVVEIKVRAVAVGPLVAHQALHSGASAISRFAPARRQNLLLRHANAGLVWRTDRSRALFAILWILRLQ